MPEKVTMWLVVCIAVLSVALLVSNVAWMAVRRSQPPAGGTASSVQLTAAVGPAALAAGGAGVLDSVAATTVVAGSLKIGDWLFSQPANDTGTLTIENTKNTASDHMLTVWPGPPTNMCREHGCMN